MLSSCGHDERGKYSGGQAGDQTGTEYYIRPFYVPSYGWDCILRHPDARVGERIAEIATQAAKNSRIGYDQGQRLTYYNALKTAGWHPEKIMTPCESDCSASTAAAIIAAGHQLGLTRLQQISPSCTTWTLKKALITAGFECLTESRYRVSDAYLLPGDIVLSEAHHVVINLTAGAQAAKKPQKENTVKQYAGVVNVSSYLNVRSGPGTSYGVMKIGGADFRLPAGMVVSIEAEKTGWGKLTGVAGWVSLAYIKK